MTPHALFCVRISIIDLGEFKAEFKKALARESGAQGVLFDEKTEGRKSRATVPLMLKKTLLRPKGKSQIIIQQNYYKCSAMYGVHYYGTY
jgi:hypothetical protein